MRTTKASAVQATSTTTASCRKQADRIGYVRRLLPLLRRRNSVQIKEPGELRSPAQPAHVAANSGQ
eukprot:15445987-Alexandrium_andersonii.AAC.1